MLHPLERLGPDARAKGLRLSLIALVVCTLAIGALDRLYKTDATPWGVVSFELAGDEARAQEILDAWAPSATHKLWVAFVLGFDYLYLVVYGVAFSFGAATVAAKLANTRPGLSRIARGVAYLQLAAPLCDAVENAGLMAMLVGAGTSPYAALSSGFAIAKFVCLGLALLLFLLLGPMAARGDG